MERIWAPWRLSYVSAVTEEPGCIFCAEFPGRSDRDRLILYRSEHSLIMLNRYPYCGGHLMVAPLRHIADPGLMSDVEALDVMRLITKGQRLLECVAHPDGFNIGMNLGKTAGAGITEHVHIHIVPRWNGDSNFMTVISDTRVIPDGLFEAYDRFAAAMAGMEQP